MHVWTDDEVNFIREIAPGRSVNEVRVLCEERFGQRYTNKQINYVKSRHGIKSGFNPTSFKKGRIPHNKGKGKPKPPPSGRTFEDCQFKKGNLPPGAKPVGAERVTIDGFIEVHISERTTSKPNDNWKMKHRIIWEEAYGEVPEGHYLVFADGNKRNFDLDNIVAVPRKYLTTISTKRIPYYDRESLEIAIAIAKLREKANEAQSRPRPCRVCGVIFRPRYPKQKTCDKCLGRVEDD